MEARLRTNPDDTWLPGCIRFSEIFLIGPPAYWTVSPLLLSYPLAN